MSQSTHRYLRKVLTLSILLILSTGGNRAMAWKGFEYKTWLEISKAQRLDLITPQAGHAELLPLLQTSFTNPERIRTVAGWEQKRTLILQTLETLLGTPSDMKVAPPSCQVLGEEDLGTYFRQHLILTGEVGDPIPAYLLYPKPMPIIPTSTVIVLHQTQAPGKQEAVGMTGNPEMAFGVELVQQGYVVLAYDVIGFGERIPSGEEPYHNALEFFRRHPQWSFFGKMCWDFRRVVDYLETVPMINSSRIATMGHSHGAYGSILCSIFDKRITATIASCGFTTLRTDPKPERWSHLTALIPSLGFYVDNIAQAPLDWQEILALLAPRPFFNFSTLNDEIFPKTENLPEVFKDLEKVYALYQAQGNLQAEFSPGKHVFPKEYREKAYQWLKDR